MRRAALLLLVAMISAASCASGTRSSAGADERGEPLRGELRVFAAASLTEAFTEIAQLFEDEHPALDVVLNFAASSALARQIDEGAPADVFASADEAIMRAVVDAGNAVDPRVVARNRLAILVEKGNPKAISGIADLADPGLVFVVCAPQVPCGRLGGEALRRAGVDARPASLEENVKAVVAKVTLGEADAGIVYATDVRAAGDRAVGVDLDNAGDPDIGAAYPMAVTAHGENVAAARAWAELVRSARGRAVLAAHGFLEP